MAVLATWALIGAILLLVWVGYVYSYSKIVKRENHRLKEKLAHAEAELDSFKSKKDWGSF